MDLRVVQRTTEKDQATLLPTWPGLSGLSRPGLMDRPDCEAPTPADPGEPSTPIVPASPLCSRAQSRIRLEVSAVHHPRHDQAAEYRRQAQEIRIAVEKISINEAREQLLATAEHLEALAKEEERKAQASSATSDP